MSKEGTKLLRFDKLHRTEGLHSYYFKIGTSGIHLPIKVCTYLDTEAGTVRVPIGLVLNYSPFREYPTGTSVIGDSKQARVRLTNYLN